MSGKRSKRGKVQRFDCPHCDSRLWRLGSEKHRLFYTQLTDMVQSTGMHRKQAAALMSRGDYVDSTAWIEEFFCGEHGKMWMLVRQDGAGCLRASLPSEQDWQRTTGTVHPHLPNPSVSEFTYRMSRGVGLAR
ncbi:hypothetical protein [Gloeobacter kilaueensis]|uniref:Uncharacterized protein n=1 Tax=Gloeobacter kilaueensis (strain ATCC BAA-2537 / CCAP 1431/1 / ULC 316 / JS1) TaxID=1183438 RepID=U5QFW0_GLOK1|nr:hypothetical protein [Gloeobacter kilaueensis]AGY56514.1 hypothetical protein GKIL_0267 [Gloeobacter kilaueensis JS1]